MTPDGRLHTFPLPDGTVLRIVATDAELPEVERNVALVRHSVRRLVAGIGANPDLLRFDWGALFARVFEAVAAEFDASGDQARAAGNRAFDRETLRQDVAMRRN